MLLDEDSQAKYLVNLLQVAGHDVAIVNSVNLMNCPDALVLDFARQNGRVLVNPIHAGILAVYQDADIFKNMNYQQIVKAIANLESAEYVLEN